MGHCVLNAYQVRHWRARVTPLTALSACPLRETVGTRGFRHPFFNRPSPTPTHARRSISPIRAATTSGTVSQSREQGLRY